MLASGPIRILGIDPGSRITGYGIIDSDGRRSVHVASGCIRTTDSGLPARLQVIFRGVQQLMAEYHPAAVAVEQVFMARNADSALKLGQARSAAICATFEAGGRPGPEVYEYAARAIKQAIVGIGHADKAQVSHMVAVLLNHREALQVDASDALAVALCHAHTRPLSARLAALPQVDATMLARTAGRLRGRPAGRGLRR
jgi:crossover junction endodeoxyribonuclease RuvC